MNTMKEGGTAVLNGSKAENCKRILESADYDPAEHKGQWFGRIALDMARFYKKAGFTWIDDDGETPVDVYSYLWYNSSCWHEDNAVPRPDTVFELAIEAALMHECARWDNGLISYIEDDNLQQEIVSHLCDLRRAVFRLGFEYGRNPQTMLELAEAPY